MASFVAKIISKKILGETIQNKFGKEDPYFESVPATRLDGKPSTSGRVKKRKKALPPGISEHDGEVLTKVKRRAYRLDMSLFTFMGIRFGWGSVIGFIPAIGDVLDMFMALMVFKSCSKIDGGLPQALKIKMMLNIIMDFVVGLIPFLGDLADAAFRANTRNVILLEEHLRQKGKDQLRASGRPIPAIDPSEAGEFDRGEDGRSPVHSRQPSREPSTRSTHREAGHATVPPTVPAQPPAAEVRESRGWFGRNTSRAPDIETGEVNHARESRREIGRAHV